MRSYAIGCIIAFLSCVGGYFLGSTNSHPSGKDPSSVVVHFSPDGMIRESILDAVGKSQKSVDIAMYEWTDSEIADAVVAAGKRGVAVRIIADERQATDASTVIPILQKEDSAVHLLTGQTSGKQTGIMHHKFMVVDGTTVITGSYNFTYNAEYVNFENQLFIRDPLVISKYEQEFERLWEL